MDKLAIANICLGALSTGAAIAAAIYAKRSPSKEDLQRVEENTGETAGRMDGLRAHLAEVEDHLRAQRIKKELDSIANGTSITVTGHDFAADTLTLRFVVVNSDAPILRVELVNSRGMRAGVLECTASEERTFIAVADPQLCRAWYGMGDVTPGDPNVLLVMRAILKIADNEVRREFTVSMREYMEPDPRPPLGRNVVVRSLYGSC